MACSSDPETLGSLAMRMPRFRIRTLMIIVGVVALASGAFGFIVCRRIIGKKQLRQRVGKRRGTTN